MREILFVALLLAGCGETRPDTARNDAAPTATADSTAATPMPAAPPVANAPRPEVPAPPPVSDYDYRRPGIDGLDSALRYRARLSDGRATPTDIRQFLERLDTCQYERIPRHAQMLSCAYTLREEMVRLQRKYRRDAAALAVFQDLALFGN